jgi:hypothetical protein
MAPAMITSLREELSVEDGTFALGDRDDPDSPLYTVGAYPSPDSTGLLATAPGFVAVTCGTGMGAVSLAVETWTGAPPIDPDDWDEVAEVSFTPGERQICVLRADFDDREDIPLDLPPGGPTGSYRVRDCARDRDAGEDRGPEDPVETHRIQIWAAPAEPDALVKTTDATGAMWRAHGDSA